MAIYERGAGGHIAERIQAEPGSEEDAAYAALADDPASGWRRIDAEPAPRKTTRRGKEDS